MSCDDIARIQHELVPMIQEVVNEWHIIHFLGTTSSESPSIADFSSQLSSLQIGRLNVVNDMQFIERQLFFICFYSVGA